MSGSFEGKEYARSLKILRGSSDAGHVEEAKLVTKLREIVKEYHKFSLRADLDRFMSVR